MDQHQPAFHSLKGFIILKRKNYSEVVNYLKKSLSIFPQDVSSHYFLGMSYYRMSMHKTAVPHLNLFAEVQSEYPEIHGILGICYEKTGEPDAAYKEYVKQLNVDPNNEMGRYAAIRVSVLKSILERTEICK